LDHHPRGQECPAGGGQLRRRRSGSSDGAADELGARHLRSPHPGPRPSALVNRAGRRRYIRQEPSHTTRTLVSWRLRGDAISAPACKRGGIDVGAPGVLGAILLAGILAGCATPTPQSAPPARGQAPAPRVVPAALRGQPFTVVADESHLTILVYRAGALAALEHNHVVSCRCLSGTVYVPRDPLRAGFDLRVVVAGLTVDDPVLRAAEHSRDFPPDGSSSARQGTRHNMLSAALLNAAAYPDITLRSERLRQASDGRRAASRVPSQCRCTTTSDRTRSG